MVVVVCAAGAFLFGLGVVMPLVLPKRSNGQLGIRKVENEQLGTIDVVIAAYLEASVIEGTVRSLKSQLATSRIPGKVIVVASDDDTYSAAACADQRIRAPRNGKPSAINAGVVAAQADVVVLTDANCLISPDDWPLLVMKGLESTRLLTGNKREKGARERLFWLYEQVLKSRVKGSDSFPPTLAVIGEFLAFRRSDYRPIAASTLADDLALALDFHKRDLRVATVPSIYTLEDPAPPAEQWERRVRIACGLLSEALPSIPDLARSSVGRSYLVHKVYRVTIGVTAFWIAVVASAFLLPPYGAVTAIGTVAWAVLRYRGVIKVRSPIDSALDVIAMQAVPLAGFARLIRRKFTKGARAGWTKVPR